MATVMEMPKLSDTMKEGAVARWLKKEGEKVTAGVPVVEIETDKATMEFESPATGTLLKVIVGDGGTCELNAPIAVIGKPEEKWEEAVAAYTAKKKGGAAKAAPAVGSAKPSAPAASAPSADSAPAPQAASTSNAGPIKASPLAKRVAADKGVDLSQISGSGPNGRIIVRDLENVNSASGSATAGASSAAAFAVAAGPEMEKMHLSMMRKTIARRLTESVTQAPHFFLTVSINMGGILAWRKDTVAKLPDEKKFSVNDLLVFIVARALKRHLAINSSWQTDYIAQYNSVHMGVAVALPGGLVTPVVRHADKLNIFQIAQKTKELIKLARDGKLAPEEYQGGTFTISNLGMSGIEEFTAIINPPQAAILAVGATVPTPVVDAKGNVVVEQRMKVTLSCDHRVIDGAVGSEFLKTLKQFLEDPVSALFLG